MGDVLAPAYQYFEFPLHPDPTQNDLPKHMYDNDCLKNGNAYQVSKIVIFINRKLCQECLQTVAICLKKNS